MALLYIPNKDIFALVDDEDLVKVSKYRWHRDKSGYACRGVRGGAGKIKLHREILGLSQGDGVVVDHINRDKLDCRKSNLRVATDQENNFNKKPYRNAKSKFKGISKRQGKRDKTPLWVAQIQKDKKLFYLGCYRDEVSAAIAYDEAAKSMFGEFAYLNFPGGPTELQE